LSENVGPSSEFASFCEGWTFGQADRKAFWQLVRPVKQNLRLPGRDSLLDAADKLTGIGFSGSDYKFTNITAGGMGEPKFKALAFYIFKEHPEFYCRFTGLNKDVDVKHRGKPFWEIIPCLPILEPPDKNGLTNAFDDDFTPPRADLITPVWGIYEENQRSYNDRVCSLGLNDFKQRPGVGEIVEAYLEAFVSHDSCESGYSYGFSLVRVETDIRSEYDSNIAFGSAYSKEQTIAENVIAKGGGGGLRKFIELEANRGTLDDTYNLYDAPFFSLSPRSDEFEFGLKMIVQTNGLSIAKTDGSALPSETKQAIIRAIFAENLGPRNSGGWAVLCKNQYVVRPDSVTGE